MHPRARKQLFAIALGLALFGAMREPAWWALVACYGVGLLIFELARLDRVITHVPRGAFVALSLALAAPGSVALVSLWDELLTNEGLEGLFTRMSARLALESDTAIAPRLVVADRPQRFFVHARPGADVRVKLGRSARDLGAEELTRGLYRVDYDPRRDGAPFPADGALSARVRVDGEVLERRLEAATPLAHPRWLVSSPDGRLAATVSEETDELILVSARGIERRVPVGDGPVDCVFVDAQHVAISHRDEDALWIVDAKSGTHTLGARVERPMGRLALSPDAAVLAVARLGPRPALVLVDVARQLLLQRLALASPADWLAFGPDARSLVVTFRADASVRSFVSDGAGFEERERLSLGRAAVTLARSRDGSRLMLATTDYRPDGSANLGNHFVQDQLLTLELAPLRVTHALHTARRTPRQSKPGDVDRGASPMSLAQARDGAWLVVFAGTEELWRMREGSPEPDVLDLGASGLYAPHGIAELDDGTLVVSSPSAGALGLVSSLRDEPRLLRVAPSDDYLRTHASHALARRLGERTFYEATRSGISCQSCHMHADSDEAAHNLGLHRLLPTLTVQGLLGTAPYLRDGSFARVGDLDHVSQTLYRGYLRKAPGRAATLEAFVLALPRKSAAPPARDAITRKREREGARLFVRSDCVECHAFPAFTHLGQHLAATLFPGHEGAPGAPEDVLDTPSLLSIAASAPYLSDGRARTLEAVLVDHNPDNRHGDTARLTPEERDALRGFLESL